MKYIYTEKKETIIVDDYDFDLFKRFTWWLDGDGYPATRIENFPHSIRMHTLIMARKTGLVIDHIDHNKSNNQRSNLRHLPTGLNTLNTKANNVRKAKYFHETRYQSVLTVKRKQYCFGVYKEFDDAKRRSAQAKAILFKYYQTHSCLPDQISEIPEISALLKPRATKEELRVIAVRGGQASGKIWSSKKREASIRNLSKATHRKRMRDIVV